jgi:hypothetical protein
MKPLILIPPSHLTDVISNYLPPLPTLPSIIPSLTILIVAFSSILKHYAILCLQLSNR